MVCLRYLVGHRHVDGLGLPYLASPLVGTGRRASAKRRAMGWTDERVETLKKLWLDGLSASQIAKQLGGVTRNAVIGKVHRLGLSGRATPSQPQRPAFKTPRAPRPAIAASPAPRRAIEAAMPAQLPVPALAPEAPGTATVLTLG